MRIKCLIEILMIIVACWGCSSGGNNPLAPSDTMKNESNSASVMRQKYTGNRYLWGLWTVNVSADHRSMDLVPLRSAEMHFNLVNLLENVACSDCIKISDIAIVTPNEMKAYFKLQHPFDDLDEYTAFDVRGIFISGSDYNFPISERNITWSGDSPVVLNPDGYTSLFNPTEFPESSGHPILRYFEGKYSFGENLTATLNPYVAFMTEKPRRMFEAGKYSYQLVWLTAPEGPFSFGYAVDCSWVYVNEVSDPEEDFPPEANCIEPYRIEVWQGTGLSDSLDSQAPIYVEIFDHQGLDTIDLVAIEAPEIFEDTKELSYSHAVGEDSWLFDGIIVNELAALKGEYPLLVRVTSAESDPNLGYVDAWDIFQVSIGRGGWARTWGADSYDYGRGLAVDGDGDIYVTGSFSQTIDLDPGPGVAKFAPCYQWGSKTAYLSKFDSDGIFQWAVAWGGCMDEYGHGAEGRRLEVDDFGNIFVMGSFKGIVDFDPGPGTCYLPSITTYDIFVSKFDPEGNFIWACSWAIQAYAVGYRFYGDLATDQYGNVYLAGYYPGTVDFDPGGGTDIHSGGGAFLICLDPNGQFTWTKTWGEKLEYGDYVGYGVAADSSGNILAAGGFTGTVDFDPGPDSFELTSNGQEDAFISMFAPDGTHLWSASWGGIDSDTASSIDIDNSNNMWVAGTFAVTVDFDPGPGTDEHVSVGGYDHFLSVFDSGQNYQFSLTWGSEAWESITGLEVAVDQLGNAFVTGNFNGSVDFDPGPGSDIHTPPVIGYECNDFFLSKFNPWGNFQWVAVWSNWRNKHSMDVDTDMDGNAYLTGDYRLVLDFDPGPGTDYHESYSNNEGDAFLLKVTPDGTW